MNYLRSHLELDCKTVVFFANPLEWSSIERSGTNVKTESETGERRYSPRLACPTGVRDSGYDMLSTMI